MMTLFLLISLVFGAGGAVYAQSDAEDVDLAIVNTAEVVEADDEIMFSEISSIADDLGYELAVDLQSLKWHVNDEVDGVSNFGSEDVTEEVNEIIGDSEDIEEAKDKSGVEDITDRIINNL